MDLEGLKKLKENMNDTIGTMQEQSIILLGYDLGDCFDRNMLDKYIDGYSRDRGI